MKDEVLDAEIIKDITTPDYSKAEVDTGPAKKLGTRKADFPKFTPAVREKLLDLVSKGVPDNHACNQVGISISTFYRWLEKGRVHQNQLDEGEELYPVEQDFASFHTHYYRVKSSPVTNLVTTIMEAALGTPDDFENGIPGTPPNPGLALKLLEKLDPEQFGNKQSIKVEGRVGHVHATVDQLNQGEDIAKSLSTEELRFLKADIKAKKEAKLLEANNK